MGVLLQPGEAVGSCADMAEFQAMVDTLEGPCCGSSAAEFEQRCPDGLPTACDRCIPALPVLLCCVLLCSVVFCCVLLCTVVSCSVQ
jgi:hypothetical protein